MVVSQAKPRPSHSGDLQGKMDHHSSDVSFRSVYPVKSSQTLIVIFLLVGSVAGFAQRQDPAIVWENTGPNIKYIGTQQCAGCRTEEHASYLKTTHSIATAITDPRQTPAAYEHPALEFRYEVERKNGRLVHREAMPDAENRTLAVTEKPMEYSIGSGAHAKSYLFKAGPFFGQSPLTWYQEPNAWRMSPGYEIPFHPSFHRRIGNECVFCHVGNIDRKENNPYQFEIIETTIGCERCHGPGELHAKKHHGDSNAKGDDHSIVNPALLSRELAEAICQQCHLQGASWVTTTGKEMWDFCPGLPITDVRVDYQFALGGGQMRIVGHVEQMHASKCYTQTETLTCTTCHDPHNPITSEHRIDFYRDVCLKCHEDQSCHQSLDVRMQSAGNNCYQCHMPKADTNVTHTAFHHHRIGIHRETTGLAIKPKTAELLPILDISSLPERERIRCAALAKVLALRGEPANPDYHHFGIEATEALIKLKNSGPVDAVSDSQLALLALAQNQRKIAMELAQESLVKDPRPTLAHIEATGLLARAAFQDGDKELAVKLYRNLTSLQRDAGDMYHLGLCESNVGNIQAAVAALQKSLDIDPTQVGPHAALQAVYEANKQPDKAAFHAESQKRMTEMFQKLSQKALSK